MSNNTTTETRRESYEAITTETSKRGVLILDVLGNKQMTVDEIVYELIERREILHFDRNFVAPRLTELKEAGAVEVIGKRKSPPHGEERRRLGEKIEKLKRKL